MSLPAIRLSDSNDFVELEVLECGTFAGSYDAVWIAKDAWSSFRSSMRRLERDRNGQASLRSMSPDEFELHIQVTDCAGHLVAHGCLSRYHFGHPSGNATRLRIEYRMSVDPSLLRELVLSLEGLSEARGGLCDQTLQWTGRAERSFFHSKRGSRRAGRRTLFRYPANVL